jgi:subtilase family serine protease
VIGETKLAFAPKPTMAPVVVAYGPFISPSPPHEKQPFTVTWTFENVGNSDSSETQVDLYIDSVKEGDTKTVSKLASGKVTSISWSVTKQYTGFVHTAEIRSVSASGPMSLGTGQFTMEP